MLLKMQIKLQAAGLEMFMQNTVVPWLKIRAAKRFTSEGDDASGKWTPLKKATEGFRTRQGFPAAHPINVRTLQMFDFITSANGSMTGGSGYASLNWPGSSGRAKKIDEKIRTAQGLKPGVVARPVLGLSQRDDIFIAGRLLTHLLS
jgi:hypothetical protein